MARRRGHDLQWEAPQAQQVGPGPAVGHSERLLLDLPAQGRAPVLEPEVGGEHDRAA